MFREILIFCGVCIRPIKIYERNKCSLYFLDLFGTIKSTIKMYYLYLINQLNKLESHIMIHLITQKLMLNSNRAYMKLDSD